MTQDDKVPIESLYELSYNPRKIRDEGFERLKASIQEYAVAIPESDRMGGYRLTKTIQVNVNGNRIIGGHQRIKALKALGQNWIHAGDITWVDVVPDSTREQALNIVLNSEKFRGQWDEHKITSLENSELFKRLTLSPVDVALPEVDVDLTEMFPSEKGDVLEGKSPEIIVEPETPGSLYPVSYAVTLKQRRTIFAAIKKAREEMATDENSDALSKLCQQWTSKRKGSE